MQWLTWLFTWPSKLTPTQRRVLYWVLHVLVVLAILAGLTAINYLTGLDRVLRTRLWNLHRVWLPLLFVLAYVLFWLIRWIYWLLGPDGPGGEFDDIEQAWAESCRQMEQAGISMRELPLYLVLGKPSGTLEAFFAASHLPFQLRHAPDRLAPLHVYAGRNAIFVTCDNASLLPVGLKRLFEEVIPTPPPVTLLGEEALTLPGEMATQSDHGGTATLTTPTVRRSVLLLGEQEPPPDAPTRGRSSLLRDLETVDLQTRRLRHLCKLLLRDRSPYCPVNGILALLPLAATDTKQNATEVAEVLRHDFEVSQATLQLDCPRFVVLCDAEQLPGFADLARHFPDSATGPSWVLGQHYPLLPDVPPAQVAGMVESGMAWVADTLLPVVVGGLWRREGEADVTDRGLAINANRRLYSFLGACRQRLTILARLAGRAVSADDRPPLLGGCYLAGTGADARDQAFLAGVLRLALEQQNSVRWTGDALRDDAAYAKYSWVGYVLLGVFVLVVVATLVAWW